MNDYDAMMKAAELIEQRPNMYNFNIASIHDSGPRCMLGWFAKFSENCHGMRDVYYVARDVLKMDPVIFYEQILSRIDARNHHRHDMQTMLESPQLVAPAMRQWANSHLTPEALRAIKPILERRPPAHAIFDEYFGNHLEHRPSMRLRVSLNDMLVSISALEAERAIFYRRTRADVPVEHFSRRMNREWVAP